MWAVAGDGRRLDGSSDPWFRRRPRVAVALALALYAVVLALRIAIEGPEHAISVLYVLPVALVALAFGLRAGALAGAAAVGLSAAWAITEGVSLGVIAWLARALPLLLVGVLVGQAADRIREAAEAHQRAAVAELRQREAAEINDSIIQGLAVAKWAIETGAHDRGLAVLTETIETAQRLVADLLNDRPLRPGRLTAESPALGPGGDGSGRDGERAPGPRRTP